MKNKKPSGSIAEAKVALANWLGQAQVGQVGSVGVPRGIIYVTKTKPEDFKINHLYITTIILRIPLRKDIMLVKSLSDISVEKCVDRVEAELKEIMHKRRRMVRKLIFSKKPDRLENPESVFQDRDWFLATVQK